MADPGYEYVALQRIDEGGVIAYQKGDLVPAANVADRGYTDEQVELRDVPVADVEEPGDPALVPPAKSASKPEWVDFAVAAGALKEDAEAMTHDQLVEHFSPA